MTRLDALKALLAKADRQQLPTTPIIQRYAADPVKLSCGRNLVLTSDDDGVKIGGTE